jgi:hypothetical protein
MYELDAAKYHEAVSVLANLVSMADGRARPPQDSVMPPENAASSIQMLDRFLAVIDTLHVPVTKITVLDAKSEIGKSGMNFFNCGQLLLNVSNTLRRELQTVKVFTLDSSEAAFYAPKGPLFGADVAANFPSIAYDINECGKCYALGRSTASVFHAIRCLEAAIRAIYRCLGLPDPIRGVDRNWGMILKKVNEEMDIKWPKSSRIGGDGKRFEGFVAALTSMQNPYRNATMHLDEKYTEGEAKYIFEMVGGLMKSVALRMDEEGLPLAR